MIRSPSLSFLFVSTVVWCQNVGIPAFSEQSYNCTFPGVDPTLQISTEAFQPRGKVDNCQDLCASETLFNCSSFTWAGPGTHCTLHGQISQTLISPKHTSGYNLTDFGCVKNGTGHTSIKYCSFDDRRISISTPSSAKSSLKNSAAECQSECEMDPLITCSSFGFDPNATAGAKNCITFRRDNTTSFLASGSFHLYENRCRVNMVACVKR